MSDSTAVATADSFAEVVPGGPGSFRGSVLNGLAWKAASRGTFELTKLAVAIVLARLLTPHQYGLAGFAIVLISFQPVLCGTALASALVQREHITEADRSTVFWFNAATGLFFTLLGVMLSLILAPAFGDPAVGPLFAATSCCYFISALGITQSELLIRAMRFRALETRAMAGVVAGAVLAVVAAALGWGPWAIVLQQLGYFTTATILLWLMSDWRPKCMFSRQSLRELRAFGGNITGTMLLTQLNQNTSRLLVGGTLGTAALGAYALGYNVILAPVSRVTAPLFDVLYTVYSKLRDDRERLTIAWLRVVRLTVAITLPSMMALMVLAPQLVPIAFGSKWHSAVPVIQILAWVGVLISLQGINEIMLQSIDNTGLALRFASILCVTGVGAFLVGLHWGLVGVSISFAAVSTIIQPWYTHRVARAVGTDLWTYARAIKGVVFASVISTAAVAFTQHILLGAGMSDLSVLLAAAAAGTIAYALGVLRLAPELTQELTDLVGRRRRRGAS